MNLQQLLDLIKQNPGWSTILVAAVILFLQWKNGNLAKFATGKWDIATLPSTGTENAEGTLTAHTLSGDDQNDRLLAFESVNFLVEYFSDIGCPEGEAAARACGPHLFHSHPPPTPSG